MLVNYRVISSDDHVFEPPDLWTSRAKPAFKDRIPKLVREYDGDWWFCDGHRCVGMAGGAQTGMRFEAPEQLVRTTTFDNIRRGGCYQRSWCGPAVPAPRTAYLSVPRRPSRHTGGHRRTTNRHHTRGQASGSGL